MPTLWRIDAETLAVSAHPLALDSDTDKDVGFSGLVYSREHGAFFGVSGMLGSLWTIDRSLTQARKIALDSPVKQACRIAIAARLPLQDSARLCVRPPRNDWTIALLDGRRAGQVHEAPCPGLPWQLSQLSFRLGG